MKCKAILQLPKQAFWGFLEDNGFTLAGALAFYAMLSLAPLLVLLLWVYYSSLIFFYGAELTQAYAKCCGAQIVPSKFAEWTPEMAAKLRQQKQPQEQKPPEPSPPTHTEAKP